MQGMLVSTQDLWENKQDLWDCRLGMKHHFHMTQMLIRNYHLLASRMEKSLHLQHKD
jgi:hypothetical protein